jgi:hypothetical protein
VRHPPALQKLEYRGYDSAGICIDPHGDGASLVVKSTGAAEDGVWVSHTQPWSCLHAARLYVKFTFLSTTVQTQRMVIAEVHCDTAAGCPWPPCSKRSPLTLHCGIPPPSPPPPTPCRQDLCAARQGLCHPEEGRRGAGQAPGQPDWHWPHALGHGETQLQGSAAGFSSRAHLQGARKHVSSCLGPSCVMPQTHTP